MSIEKVQNVGLKISLDDYSKLRRENTGSDFWFHDNQAILTKKLKPFLPRMEYKPGEQCVIASIVERGKEQLSNSEQIAPNLSNVPSAELRKLRAALNAFNQEVAESSPDTNLYKLGTGFSLPMPDKAPELYRVYGGPINKKIAIVWGLCPRDIAGGDDFSAIGSVPEVLAALPVPPAESKIKDFLTKYPIPIAIGAIALLAIAGLATCDDGSDTPKSPVIVQQPVTQQPVTQQPVTQQPVTQQLVTQQLATQQNTAKLVLSSARIPCTAVIEKQVHKGNGQVEITLCFTPNHNATINSITVNGQKATNGCLTMTVPSGHSKLILMVETPEGRTASTLELNLND